jgi:hypothetical protein
MSNGLTEEELERIETFAKTPKHARSPEMLLPGYRDVPDVVDVDQA